MYVSSVFDLLSFCSNCPQKELKIQFLIWTYIEKIWGVDFCYSKMCSFINFKYFFVGHRL